MKLEQNRSIVSSTSTLFHETEVLVSVKNDQVVTSSLQVAEYFGKTHQHVLRDIRFLINEKDVSKIGQMFEEAEFPDKYGRMQPMYLMNRDGFTLLAMGFTGKKALDFKIAYINAFNEMEEMLRNNQATEYAKKLLKAKVETFNKRMQAGTEYGRKKHGNNYGGAGSMIPTLPFSDSLDLDSNLNNIFAFVGNSYGDSMYFISELFKKDEELKELKKRISQFTYDMGSKFGLY